MSDTHECPAEGCHEQLPFAVLACKPHWFAIPPRLRARLSVAWNRGDMETYLKTREEAVQALAGVEA